MTRTKWIYTFGEGAAEGRAGDAGLLGAKGANLAELSMLGLAVPPGFTVTAEACNRFTANGGEFPPGLEAQLAEGLAHIARLSGRRFGAKENPLLLSVRPGARIALPGLSDTLLNLGLNGEITEGLAQASGAPRFAWDCFRRLVAAYGDTVLGVDLSDILEDEKARLGKEQDEFSAEEWREVVRLLNARVDEETGEPFPETPREQLHGAIRTAFASWMSPRAVAHRRLHDIPDDWGAAVTVQAMVFGNHDDRSAAGIASTRDPSAGGKALNGRFLVNAQGDELAGGIRPPENIGAGDGSVAGRPSLETRMPEAFAALRETAGRLEQHFRDAREFEFTIERGNLWILQSRAARLDARAVLRVAVAMAEEGLITRNEAVLRVDPASLVQFLHPAIDPAAKPEVIAVGLPASPGAAAGEIAFSAEAAREAKAQGRKAILVRSETSPEDIGGMQAAEGVLTARGGVASHAAVVARGMGKPCVSGAGGVKIDAEAATLLVSGERFRAGDTITIDGSTGQVMRGAVPMRAPELSGDFSRIMEWADAGRRMRVRANAETPAEARTARAFGAEGIGLCRTEHMFFEENRIVAVREMILAETVEGRRAALDKLVPMQRGDFAELFAIMAGLPVTIRLLDPPLHEFLPKTEAELAEAAQAMCVSVQRLRERVESLRESNPMLGHRGCRLAISFPEIVDAQARAIFEAAALAAEKTGKAVVPEIMVPLVGMRKELDFVKARIDATARAVATERGATMPYLVGTMIELPRAALRAEEIAGSAEFFSFGTNDLTQTTFGISRDDAAGFLETYRKQGIVEQDPFAVLDTDGVGELMQLAAERGRRGRPDISLGICGEHGAEPAGIVFCEAIGLDYISCSPFRVPIARLAAAQAALRRR